MIQYFNTEAEYQAAALGKSESHVSFVGADHSVKFDGSNVVVGAKGAKTYDGVFLDSYGALRFIPYGTFLASGLPAGWTKVGVVFMGVDHPDYRGKIGILAGEASAATRVWSYIYSFRLTGYTLDGTDRTGDLVIYTASSTTETFTVSYNASTVDELVAQLNAFFTDTTNPVFQTQDWVAENNGGAIDLKFHFTFANQRSNAGANGFTMAANLLPEIAANSAMYRINGVRTSEGTVLNMPRALTYFRQDLAAGTYNPTTVQTAANAKRTYPICLPGYLGTSANVEGDMCAAIRGIFGEGEEGWKKFMATFLPVWPAFYGSLKNPGYGKDNTAIMAAKTFTGQNGTPVAAFPAASYCADISFNHALLGKGSWFMPDAGLVYTLLKNIQYSTTNNRNADPMNTMLNAMGFAALNNGAALWSSSRSGAYSAWFFGGPGGCAGSNFVYIALRALPVVLLDVNNVNA